MRGDLALRSQPPLLGLYQRDGIAVATGSQYCSGRFHEKRLVTEFVEQLTIVTDEQTHTFIYTERGNQQITRVGVNVSRGLVDREEFRRVPQGSRNLRAFPLTVTERGPARHPRGIDSQATAQTERFRFGRFQKIRKHIRRIVRSL